MDMALITAYQNDLALSSTLRDRFTTSIQSTTDITPYITDISSQAIDGGARGDIYTARYKDGQVAIKSIRMLPTSSSPRRMQHILREPTNWMRLSHPNILEF
ncbi:hypothetical protein CALVIDRAFT_596187 [Calocera viscosa TUFC12733]|uniref:Protein kinase domain-containing protein n=1 Tax=Calocera viscosa (strain TUFC12733) TaxID=1330018 RepID=A0A167PRM6_CALVF|nr:hypothetical protein CALVIDRAFT_596187 [Calocera viscosa TUFC12733]